MNKQECKKLENRVLKILERQIKKNDCVILGLSGGPDSVFLLKMLTKLKEKTKFKIIAAHVNHLLRGRASEMDEKFARDIAKKSGGEFEMIKKNVDKESKKAKKGLEETGREIRYDFFKKLAKKHKASLIITAHHADDNLETIVMNFARGAHLKGLYGMEEIEKITNQTKLFRPLLSLTKNDIIEYLKLNKIPYRQDKTNKDTKYTRNFIRHKIIPELKKLNPNLAKSVAKNTDNIREVYQYISRTAKEWIKKNALNKKFTEFMAKEFKKEKRAIKKQILIEIHRIIIGTTKDLKKIHIDEVLSIIENGLGNKKKKLGKLVIYLKNGIIKILSNK